jgi:electron transfer flavoprotein alpha subunit
MVNTASGDKGNPVKKIKIFVLAEVREERIHPVSFELLHWGRKLLCNSPGEVVALVLGATLRSTLEELVAYGGDRVEFFTHPNLSVFDAQTHAQVLLPFLREEKPDIILAAATVRGRALMPYLAAQLQTGLTADCTDLALEVKTGLLLQKRPAIGGNVLATIKTPHHRPQMSTIRPRLQKPLPRHERRTGVITIHRLESCPVPRVKRLCLEKKETSTLLEDQELIIAGGRGLKHPKNFALLFEIAHLLHGAVGASRVAVDMGWVSYPHQVGLSGKTVSPKIYLAVGISGAVQHLSGVMNAETIIAINKDPQAPIFRVADFGAIGDALEILPHLYRKLKARNDHAVQES